MLFLLGLGEIMLLASSLSILHQEEWNKTSSSEISQDSLVLQDFDDPYYYFPLPTIQQQQYSPVSTKSQAEESSLYKQQVNMTFNDPLPPLLEQFIMNRTTRLPTALSRSMKERTMDRSLGASGKPSGTTFSVVPAEDDHLMFSARSGRGDSNGGTGGNQNSVVFGSNEIKPNRPNTDNIKNQYTGNYTTNNGTCKNDEVFFQSNCHQLLRQGPCSADQWLVEINGKGICKNTICHYPKIPYNGRCLDNNALRYNQFQNCPKGMSIVISKDGTVSCDCLPEYIYNPKDGQCYEAYRQGPCSYGQYFVLQSGAVAPSCARNPCRMTDYVCYGQPTCPIIKKQSDCVKLRSLCDNGNGMIMADVMTLKVTCVKLTDLTITDGGRTIANVPLFACPTGSKRDVNGICRKPTSFTFS